jgi:glutamyl-tRNA reductase
MTTRKRTYVSVFGVNHDDTELSARQEFYLSEIEYKLLLENYSAQNIENVFVLNTCNRTEVYTMSDSLLEVINIYRDVKKINNEHLHNHSFIKYDKEALQHFFQVGCGLRSKILGDYQIIGQMRTAYNESVKHGLIGTGFERLFQSLFSAGKEITNRTKFNDGSASHGYQVANIINGLSLSEQSRILLIGVGDMAQKILNHMRDYSKHPVTIVNRTYSKLYTFEGYEQVNTARLENLPYLIKKHDVVISTIPVDDYLNAGQAANLNAKGIFDLTVPSSISILFNASKHQVFDIDAIEEYTQKTLNIREKAIPQVEALIDKYITNYYKWSSSNQQNKIFRLFETELENYLKKESKRFKPDFEIEVSPKKITELFMKNYYSKLVEKSVV